MMESTKIDMNVESHDENGKDAKEQDGVYKHGLPICTEASEFDVADAAWQLENQPRRKQNKQEEAYQNGCPIRHFLNLILGEFAEGEANES